MTFVEQLLAHDEWTTRQLLTICVDVDEQVLDQAFDMGHRSIRSTFDHIVSNMEIWSAMMAGSGSSKGTGRSINTMLKRLTLAGEQLRAIAQSVENHRAWESQWLDVLDDPPTRKRYGTTLAHVITHSMHHRAQVMWMMRQVGMTDLPEGDVFAWARSQELRESG